MANLTNFITALIFMVTAHSALAAESKPQTADYLQAQLLSSVKATGEAQSFSAALDIKLDDGWYSYWRMPGEGGLPPSFNWEGSENITSVDIQWPVPQRFETFGLYSFGYKNTVSLPLIVNLKETGKAAKLALEANIMVCNNICVPQKVTLNMTIPSGSSEESQHRQHIDDITKLLPKDNTQPGLKIENAVVGPDAVVVTAYSQQGYDQADLFIEMGDIYITAKPDITPDEKDPRKAIIKVVKPEHVNNLMKESMGKDLVLTLTNGKNAVEQTISF